jgi:hypothetical protein
MPQKPLTEEQRLKRNEYMREFMRESKKKETPEEREKRLARIRENETKRRAANREQYNAKQRERRANDKERYRENNRRYYSRNHEKAYLDGLSAGKRYRVKVRLEALRAYSKADPICVCCGETTLEFLALDHIDGGGNAHRKSIRPTGIVSMYEWARRNGYPPLFQVLCHNCNLAKGFYGRCPHGGYIG